MSRIPKKIHYCWVGDAPKPQSVLTCIESWKKYCPDYEIIEWNETDYDFGKNDYMQQAYEAKKWGFVPDYARLDIVYEHGGIYLDTDVEMVAGFDRLLELDAFMGFEDTGDGEFFVNCGHGFGAVPHHPIIGRARDLYESVSFVNADGSLNMLPSPHYTTQSLKEFGLKQENRDQELPGMTVFASDVLCPKTFRTKKLHLTKRTVSIHHFTASWLDEKIRAEMEHQQAIRSRFGEKLGGRVLVAESVLEKYPGKKLITELPGRILRKGKAKAVCAVEALPYYRGLANAVRTPTGTGGLVLLDTAEQSDNCGDQIIMECCLSQLSSAVDLRGAVHISTHRLPTREERVQLLESRLKILCGTNVLSGHMRSYGLWRMAADVAPLKNTVLLGVGFDSQREDFDRYSQSLFRTILSRTYLHSARDRFTQRKLREMGIENVLYTGCPTMWGLTPEKCASIPKRKAENVVCTLTDYQRDPVQDQQLLRQLQECYERVYFWAQGRHDLEYLQELGWVDRVRIVPNSLSEYDRILQMDDLDYVGTRLHAGIRAISSGHRALVVSIDNRARCIGEDTGLPVIERAELAGSLKQRLTSDFETRITLHWEEIRAWKGQFELQ